MKYLITTSSKGKNPLSKKELLENYPSLANLKLVEENGLVSVILEDLHHLNIMSMHVRRSSELTELMIGYHRVEDNIFVNRINICDGNRL